MSKTEIDLCLQMEKITIPVGKGNLTSVGNGKAIPVKRRKTDPSISRSPYLLGFFVCLEALLAGDARYCHRSQRKQGRIIMGEGGCTHVMQGEGVVTLRSGGGVAMR